MMLSSLQKISGLIGNTLVAALKMPGIHELVKSRIFSYINHVYDKKWANNMMEKLSTIKA